MKKIMFNNKYGLTKAVLERRKTQTRRMLNPTMLFQRLKTYEGWSNEEIRAWKRSCNRRLYEAQGDMLQQMLDYALSYSHYKVGEEVAVAQSYGTMANEGGDILANMLQDETTFKPEYCGAGWKNKMFVKANLMPYRIKITNVRVERLQDISEEDCLKEGVEKCGTPTCHNHYCTRDCDDCAPSPKEAFAVLIDKVSGKGTWESNPWVFVYEFELIR